MVEHGARGGDRRRGPLTRIEPGHEEDLGAGSIELLGRDGQVHAVTGAVCHAALGSVHHGRRRDPVAHRFGTAGLDHQVLTPVELADLRAEPVKRGLEQLAREVGGPGRQAVVDSRQAERVATRGVGVELGDQEGRVGVSAHEAVPTHVDGLSDICW